MKYKCRCNVCKFLDSLKYKTITELIDIIVNQGEELSMAKLKEEAFNLMLKIFYPELLGSSSTLVAADMIVKRLKNYIGYKDKNGMPIALGDYVKSNSGYCGHVVYTDIENCYCVFNGKTRFFPGKYWNTTTIIEKE